MDVCRDITAETLATAGIDSDDRVIVALNADGAGVAVKWSEAASLIGQAAFLASPKDPARIAHLAGITRATTLVTTPTVAARLLRHCRASGWPAGWQIRRLFVTGEINTDRDLARLHAAFDAAVTEIWCDPIFGLALASRRCGTGQRDFIATRPNVLADIAIDPARCSGNRLREWVVLPVWSAALRHHAVLTGVAGPEERGARLPRPCHTVGDHLLLRGRWIHAGRFATHLDDALGEQGWSLVIERGLSGDRARLLTLRLSSSELAAVEDAMRRYVPVRIGRQTVSASELPPQRILDFRGQHLGPRAAAPTRSVAGSR